MSENECPGGRVDRYKASSLAAYDGPLAERYDTSFAVRLFDVTVMDDFKVGQAGRLLSSHGWLVEQCERLNWWAWGAAARRTQSSDALRST